MSVISTAIMSRTNASYPMKLAAVKAVQANAIAPNNIAINENAIVNIAAFCKLSLSRVSYFSNATEALSNIVPGHQNHIPRIPFRQGDSFCDIQTG